MDSSKATSEPAGRASFCHLHVHTDFSALDGACKVEDLVAQAVSNGMPAVAVTDHGVLSGAIQFYQKAKAAGVKPIIGLEAYVVEDRFRKETATTRSAGTSPCWPATSRLPQPPRSSAARPSSKATTTSRGRTMSCSVSTPRV